MSKTIEATEDELKWAALIKDAAEKDPDLHTDIILDLEYLHHGIVATDNVNEALKRLKRMQRFKERHGIKIDGSYEEGMRDIRMFQEAHQGFFLSLGVLPNQSTVVSVDYSALRARKVKRDESFSVLMRGMFYVMQAGQSNVSAMRSGMSLLADGKNMGWKNSSFQVEEKIAALYSHSYPMHVNHLVLMNVSLLMRAFHNICTVFVTKEHRAKHTFVARLDEYLQQSSVFSSDVLPAAWNGNIDQEKFQQIFNRKLQERYKFAEEFRL